MSARKQLELFDKPKKSSKKPAAKKTPDNSIAERMASKQREISISEFFAKNRHLLGFDNPKKALLTTIKEAVDNSLDACEEAGILPDVAICIKPVKNKDDRFIVTITDNGPGILKSQIPKIFAKLLYGSKFHRLKMSRGQQGIGISAAGMYGQMTTGKAMKVISKVKNRSSANFMELMIDTRTNKPKILKEKDVDVDFAHGTEIRIELVAKYTRGRQSIDDYLKQTATANPHVTVIFSPPDGEEVVYERIVTKSPIEPKEIKPHPYGVEIGLLYKMMHTTGAKTLGSFLRQDFSRVTPKVVEEVVKISGLSEKKRVKTLGHEDAELLHKAFQEVKIMNPPTDCVVPIGEEEVIAGLKRVTNAEFYTSITRAPAVYRGNPFRIEVGLAYGGDKPGDEPAHVLRFANRVPLMYQLSACNITKSIIKTAWRNYNLTQPRGALPIGALTIMVHIASVWVPFTSESKEAVADYPEIRKEIVLALQEAGRKLGTFLKKRRKEHEQARKHSHIQKYIPHITEALSEILKIKKDKDLDTINVNLKTILERGKTV
jgi:DNA topoisomerase-6 subunit B